MSQVYRGREVEGLQERCRELNIPCTGATCPPNMPRLGRTLS